MTERTEYVEAYIALTRAAGHAVEARQQHGVHSPEYRAARHVTDCARARFARVVDGEDEAKALLPASVSAPIPKQPCTRCTKKTRRVCPDCGEPLCFAHTRQCRCKREAEPPEPGVYLDAVGEWQQGERREHD